MQKQSIEDSKMFWEIVALRIPRKISDVQFNLIQYEGPSLEALKPSPFSKY